MQQAGSDHFMLAKLRRDVLKQGVAIGLGYGFPDRSTKTIALMEFGFGPGNFSFSAPCQLPSPRRLR